MIDAVVRRRLGPVKLLITAGPVGHQLPPEPGPRQPASRAVTCGFSFTGDAGRGEREDARYRRPADIDQSREHKDAAGGRVSQWWAQRLSTFREWWSVRAKKGRASFLESSPAVSVMTRSICQGKKLISCCFLDYRSAFFSLQSPSAGELLRFLRSIKYNLFFSHSVSD